MVNKHFGELVVDVIESSKDFVNTMLEDLTEDELDELTVKEYRAMIIENALFQLDEEFENNVPNSVVEYLNNLAKLDIRSIELPSFQA